MAKPRIRTIRQAMDQLKENDTRSAITYCMIKKLCDTNRISSFKIDRKIYLNYDELLVYMNIKEETLQGDIQE